MSALKELSPAAPQVDRFGTFRTGDFSARWRGQARFDLSGSECEPMSLADLLAMARPDDLQRWSRLALGYTDLRGSEWLRETIAAAYDGLRTDDILCCAGAQEALTCLLQALLVPQDHAIIVVPIYPPAEAALSRQCATSGVPLRRSRDRWTLDVDEIERTLRPNTRLILLNFPNSPTGAIIEADDLARLVALCRRHGLWLVNDEIYRLTATDLGALVPPVVTLYEGGISVNSVSKGLGLPGARVGWIACRDRSVLDRALSMKSQLSTCLAGTAELLANVALRADQAIIAQNRLIGMNHGKRLRALLQRFDDLFELPPVANLAFAFPRYLGRKGVEHYAEMLARDIGLLILPSGLWRSPLASVPSDYLRVSLGRIGAASAFDTWECHLASGRRPPAASFQPGKTFDHPPVCSSTLGDLAHE